MREIKFKGKRIDTGKWVYGSLLQWKDGDATICANESENNNVLIKHDVNSDTVGQYTGLKDKNGTDVREGDLLLTPERAIMAAEWQDAKIITKCVRPACPDYVNSLSFAYPVSEVIGNRWDNPELLEEKK